MPINRTDIRWAKEQLQQQQQGPPSGSITSGNAALLLPPKPYVPAKAASKERGTGKPGKPKSRGDARLPKIVLAAPEPMQRRSYSSSGEDIPLIALRKRAGRGSASSEDIPIAVQKLRETQTNARLSRGRRDISSGDETPLIVQWRKQQEVDRMKLAQADSATRKSRIVCLHVNPLALAKIAGGKPNLNKTDRPVK